LGGGHGLGGVDLALVLLYVAALAVLAVVRGREEGSAGRQYLLAGRTLTLPAFVATLVSTWYGGVLGVGEYSYRYGLSNWVALGGPYYVTGLLFAFVLARRARASALVTVPERLLRDHGPAVGTVGALVVFVNMLPAPYLLMLGALTERVFDLDGWIGAGSGLAVGVALSAVFSMLVVFGGGFASVVRTNVLQFALMYGGFIVILPAALSAIGGFEAFGRLPERYLAWDGGLGVQAVAVWYFIALQALVEPTFYQRCYAARTPDTARRGVLVSVAFWIVFDALTTATGIAARVLLPDLANPVEAYPALADAVLPPVLRGLFYVGLIATVMSTVESYLFVAGTTLGFDVPLAWRAWRRGRAQAEREAEEERANRRLTRLGLVIATILSIALALLAESVVALWWGIGSIVTPALLLPLVGGFFPAVRAGRRATLAAIVLAPLVAVGWMVPGWLGAGQPPLGVQPIFPALAVSALFHLPAVMRAAIRGSRRRG
jgi:SSS family solute:Na+ symporter